MVPHAVLEVRTGTGETIWRFDRDGKKPEQVLTPQVAPDMAFMMSKVVEDGTGKRAILDGIKVAGKTGTTNSYRDAWFVGYTGNFVGGVWFGNDDYSSTNRMTGGTLPAMTWHDIMAYAHQGIELRPLPGLPPPTHAPPLAANATFTGNDAPQQVLLTRKGTDALVRLERLLDDASHALAAQLPAGPRARSTATRRRSSTVATATDRAGAGTARRLITTSRTNWIDACAFCSDHVSR